MNSDEITMLAASLTFIATVLTTWFLVVRFIKPLYKRITFWISTWEKFMVDWAGEPARPGRDATPGVMERLNNIDGALKNNGGSSIKDAVDRIEKRLEEGDVKFDHISSRLDEMEKDLKGMNSNKTVKSNRKAS